ncbi:MAG: tRNA dihydrouridine synthase DusB [Lachnospiraceae bacterium]|nr:tRNA dihydrouridine synthase DusB [Lachnospiraceae bacterium]
MLNNEGFKIGNIYVPGKVVLGPMAGVTDLPFRVICKRYGADLIYTEMVSAKAIMYNNKNTAELLKTDPCENPVSLQLFGNDPEIMAEQAKRIEELPFDIIDINMGCPVPKVVNNKEGSYLLNEPLLAGRIVEKISNAISKPVTAKIRIGFTKNNLNCVEVAKILEESGAKAIAVHGRTRDQFYSGEADWEMIRKVKESVKVPVIGNGDIFCAKDALRMLEETNCDAVMVARGVKGNPWLIQQIHDVLDGKEAKYPQKEEIFSVLLEHAKSLTDFKGERIAACEMRKHAAWYLAGFKNASKFRAELNSVENLKELEILLDKIQNIV